MLYDTSLSVPWNSVIEARVKETHQQDVAQLRERFGLAAAGPAIPFITFLAFPYANGFPTLGAAQYLNSVNMLLGNPSNGVKLPYNTIKWSVFEKQIEFVTKLKVQGLDAFNTSPSMAWLHRAARVADCSSSKLAVKFAALYYFRDHADNTPYFYGPHAITSPVAKCFDKLGVDGPYEKLDALVNARGLALGVNPLCINTAMWLLGL